MENLSLRSEQIEAEDNPLDSTNTRAVPISTQRLLRFVIPSLIGALLFLTPMVIDGKLTVLVAYLIDIVNTIIKPYMLPVSVAIAVVPSVLTVIVSLLKPLREHNNRFVQLFNPGLAWTLTRLVGAAVMLLVYFEAGPEWIWHRNTGGVMLYDIAPVILAIYFICAILLPLLTDYGLMEFIGILISKVFTLIFRLPGRAAIDGIASWLAASSVGIILTTQQYRSGHYSQREAASIATNFSIVSIAFSYVVLKFIKMEHVFIPWYCSVAVAGIICAAIVPKLPPLRNLPNTYFSGAKKQVADDRGFNESLLSWAFRRGVERADRAESLPKQLRNGLHVASDVAITVYPTMMLLGVGGLALIEYTTVVQTLATPLIPLLELLQLPEAPQAATAILAGFVDMLMPAIIGASIESELTRFVVAGIAVNGIIFLTEVAVMLLRANIGLNLLHLLAIWLLRLLISLPVLTLMGRLILQLP